MWSGTLRELSELVDRGRVASTLADAFRASQKRVGHFEESSWDVSVPAFVQALDGRGLDDHVVLLEASLPGASTRADVLCLGEDPDGTRRVVVVELKQWKDAAGGPAELARLGEEYTKLHPSAQVAGYRDYLAGYAASLVDRAPAALVSGVVFAHDLREPRRLGLGAARNRELLAECPVFGRDDWAAFAEHLRAALGGPPSPEFVRELQANERRPARELMRRLGEIGVNGRSPWVLVDKQRELMAGTFEPMLDGLKQRDRRRAVIVQGGPGSGKTALAMSLLLEASRRGLDSVLVATSSAQHHSLLGDLALATTGRAGPARKQTVFPLVRPSELKVEAKRLLSAKQAPKELQEPAAWRAYCADWRSQPEYQRAVEAPPRHALVVCDEAQGLVDSLKPNVDGSPANHWRASWGPQAWHVMANAKVAVFFMDDAQAYRQVESTTAADLKAIAEKEGWDVEVHSLDGEQFRLAGGVEFVEWLDHLLGTRDQPPPKPQPDAAARLAALFELEDDPSRMRDRLRALHEEGDGRCRLLAGYAWEWASKHDRKALDSHGGLKIPGRAPPPGLSFRWAEAGEDGQRDFNLGINACAYAEDLFGEGDAPAIVGYPLTVRGRDLEHVGVLWGPDLVWRSDRWMADPRLVFGTDMPSLRKSASDEKGLGGKGPAMRKLVRALAGAYRILLTRGMRSVRVWIEDPETRAYVRRSWGAYLGA
jgi:hypothetical protein